jgi:hypothetical protein
MSECCPWSLDSFPYGGLCSHNALFEDVRGDFDLSADQLEAIAAEAKENTHLYMADYHRTERERSAERVNAKQREADARRSSKLSTAQKQKIHKDKADRGKASTKYYCAPCGHNSSTPSKLAQHQKSKRHLNKVAAASSSGSA